MLEDVVTAALAAGGAGTGVATEGVCLRVIGVVSAHQSDRNSGVCTRSFGAHVSAIWSGHRELAANGRARFVDAAVHLCTVQCDAPAIGIARHHRHALRVALGQMRRNGVFLEQHHREPAAQRIATAAVHAFFADRRIQRDTALASSTRWVDEAVERAGMVAPGWRHPGRGRWLGKGSGASRMETAGRI